MCRWMAYSGGEVALSELIFNTRHSLIDQSLSARSSVQTTNGDGFGVGWYDALDTPGMYKHIQPAWNDANLHDLCDHTRSPLFLAHVRAATGTAIQQTNCHPFRHDKWLFVHNGVIRDYERIRRRLTLELQDAYFNDVRGTTDSELMFYLALQFGLQDDVQGSVERMVGFIETVGREAGIEYPIQMTLGVADGRRLYAFRYSSEGASRTLYHSIDLGFLKGDLPADMQQRLVDISPDARCIVSEPFVDLPQLWEEIPESSFVCIEAGEVERREFVPRTP